jgi:LDH2 family malate/lactate/ureidoglycolate dehydrogenase
MLPTYRLWRSRGWIHIQAHPRIEREGTTTALVDGNRSLGHLTAHMAMRLAVEKCKQAGLSAVAVRNSSHFGAAGAYATLAVEQGLIGIVATSAPSRAIVPTFGIEPMFGTNPLAFAAPAGRNPPFFLDMATSTVAIGKLTLAFREGLPIPAGWALDEQGRAVTDPRTASRLHLMTPLGGGPKTSGYKGYGLAAMVEVLSNILSGNGYRNSVARRDSSQPNTVSHFFMALDPAMFRDMADFREDLDDMIDALHACTPLDPQQPVLVAGDPERRAYADRSSNGIPVSKALLGKLEEVARDAGAPFLLNEVSSLSRTGT